jgi:16S rRNA (guanine527-N7)-methyltransferase
LPKEGRLLDIGSGGGFPAIPIKICNPNLHVQLLEPNSKKVAFLKHIVRMLKLNKTEVTQGRIERESGIAGSKRFKIITARAVSGLKQTLIWCAPFLETDGLLITFQGSMAKTSLLKSEEIMEKCRLFLYDSIPYLLPGKDLERHILIFKKG